MPFKGILVLMLSSIRRDGKSVNDVYFEGCNPFKPFTMDVCAQMIVGTKIRSQTLPMCVLTSLPVSWTLG